MMLCIIPGLAETKPKSALPLHPWKHFASVEPLASYLVHNYLKILNESNDNLHSPC